MATCGTCERIRARDVGRAPLWDEIVRTDNWDLVHSYDTSLLGWLVLVPHRHVESLDELTVDESRELGELLRKTSLLLKQQLGCVKTYVMQFAEHPLHPHVHFHVVPRAAEMMPEYLGANVFNHLGVSDSDRVSESLMNEFGLRFQQAYFDHG